MTNKTSQTSAEDRSFEQKLCTPANVVTLVRICLVPVFVIVLLSPWPEWMGLSLITEGIKRWLAAGIFILISCTDWLDGYLARKRNEVTTFGKFMDPLADKILVAAALLALIELDALPSWVVLIILAREFIVSGVRMVAASEGVVIAASWLGKFKTVFQMIAIVLFTVKDAHMSDTIDVVLSDGMWLISWLVMIIALIFTIASMLDYIAKARHLLRARPQPAANKTGHTSIQPSLDEQEINKPLEANMTDASAKPCAKSSTTDVNVCHSGKDVGLTAHDEEVDCFDLATRVVEAARKRGVSLGTAESLTGGLICATLTHIPGASEVVRGSIVSYVNEVKHTVLTVNDEVLATEGAVCATVARQMAQGARMQLGCDSALSVTGIAGPGGAEPHKPVGTVYLGFADKTGVQVHKLLFSGTREEIRFQTVVYALRTFLDRLHETD